MMGVIILITIVWGLWYWNRQIKAVKIIKKEEPSAPESYKTVYPPSPWGNVKTPETPVKPRNSTRIKDVATGVVFAEVLEAVAKSVASTASSYDFGSSSNDSSSSSSSNDSSSSYDSGGSSAGGGSSSSFGD